MPLSQTVEFTARIYIEFATA